MKGPSAQRVHGGKWAVNDKRRDTGEVRLPRLSHGGNRRLAEESREASKLLRSLPDPDGFALFALVHLGLDPCHRRIRLVVDPMTLREFDSLFFERLDNLPDPR